MTDLAFGGQASPPTLPGFDLDELIARIEAKLKPKPQIFPNSVYDREEAITVTGFSLSTLIRAEQRKKLKGRWEGRRRFYLGSDLLHWLGAESESCAVCGASESIEFHENESGKFFCDTCIRQRPKAGLPKGRR